MKVERWQKVDELLEAALEREASDRSDFLKQACESDEELRREVESLLAAHLKAGSFIEASPTEDMTRVFERDQFQSIVGQPFGRYKILVLLGTGGMGEVYLAEDTSLGRRVAIKLLPKFFARDPQSRNRFLREAKLAATLDHPNICTIHEVGEASGYQFIAMQYVEGKTLGAVIGGSPLNINALLSISLQIAHALATAHTAGIIHRDIKPGNIIITQSGQVKVLDFGLAKLVEDAEGLDADKLTQTGVALGTPAYMSPEQARGERADVRSDIFSLGVVFYEMATGRLPFKGKSQHETLSAVISQPHTPVTELNKEVPAQLADLIDRALAKSQNDRHQSMRELIENLWRVAREVGFSASSIPDGVAFPYVAPKQTMRFRLRRADISTARRKLVVAALIVTFLVLASGAAYLLTGSKATSSKAIDSVAVVPLFNVGADPEMEYLADGITESIINNLSKLSNLKVMSRSLVFRYKGKEIDPQSVARDLKVQGIVTGQIVPRGDSLAVSLELVDAADNHQVWGERYERKLSDILQLQSDISRDISSKLRLKLTGEDQKHLAKRETENSEAYQLYLKGRFYWNKFTEDGFRKSIQYFKQAVDKDPSYGWAYSGLADSYSLLGEIGSALPKEAFPQARTYADKALDLDETLAEAHLSLGIVKLFYDWDWAGAEQELRRAKQLDPSNPQIYHFYGHYFQIVGRLDEGVSETKRGVDLDPTSLIVNAELGSAYYYAHQYDQAITQLRKTLELDPNFVFASWCIAQAYEQKGMNQEARAELDKARAISPESSIVSELGCVYAALGKRAEARKIIQELNERAAREHIDPVLISFIYIAVGDNDHAFARLEEAYQERAGQICWLKVEPKFDPIREDARFAKLLRQMGLAP